MRSTLVLLFLASILACAGGKGEDEQDTVEGDGAGDCADLTDNDGDLRFDCDDPDCWSSPSCDVSEGDADTDTDTDADTDTDTDADTDTDTSDAELHYDGVVDASLNQQDPPLDCVGAFDVAVRSSGTVTGTADCTVAEYTVVLEGEVDGTVRDGALAGTWYIPAFSLEIALTGEVTKRRFHAEFDDPILSGTWEGAP
jgi:hypothetical protein